MIEILAATETSSDPIKAWLGSGYGVVIIAILTALISPWLMEWLKDKFSRKLETHKLNLKREELLFEREIAAAGDFVELRDNILPRYLPDMDDSCIPLEVAEKLSQVELKLRQFKLKHYPIVSDVVRQKLGNCITIAEVNKFDSILQEQMAKGQGLIYASDETVEQTCILLEDLQDIEDALISRVRGDGV